MVFSLVRIHFEKLPVSVNVASPEEVFANAVNAPEPLDTDFAVLPVITNAAFTTSRLSADGPGTVHVSPAKLMLTILPGFLVSEITPLDGKQAVLALPLLMGVVVSSLMQMAVLAFAKLGPNRLNDWRLPVRVMKSQVSPLGQDTPVQPIVSAATALPMAVKVFTGLAGLGFVAEWTSVATNRKREAIKIGKS